MDDLFTFFRGALQITLGVFCGLTLWHWTVERERQRRHKAGLERAMQRAAERMQQPGGSVEFIPVEDWPDSLEVKDK